MFVSTLDVFTCAIIIKKLINKKACGVYNVGTSKPLSKKILQFILQKENANGPDL